MLANSAGETKKGKCKLINIKCIHSNVVSDNHNFMIKDF